MENRSNKEKKESHGTVKSEGCEDVRLLVEVMTDKVNSAEELAQDWEEIEFLVDSGASATVIGEDMVKAVKAADPNPNANYKLADGSIIPNKGYKHFVGVTEEGYKRTLNASVTDVDRPLLSVCLLYTSPSPRDRQKSRMPSSA